MSKVPRLKGIRYIRCQHLREGLQDTENAAWWVGDNLRVVVCPLCDKMHLGNMVAFLNSLYGVGVEYRRRIEEEEKYLELFTGKKDGV